MVHDHGDQDVEAARELLDWHRSRRVVLDVLDLTYAAELAVQHDLTLCDSAYAAVGRRRGAPLATLDRRLLDAGLGIRPDRLLARLTEAGR